MKQKRGLILLIVSIISIIGIIAVIFFIYSGNQSLELKINGEKVTEEEYLDAMNSQLYDVTQYFYQTYNARVSGDFWEKEFDGEVPYKMLAEKTLEKLKYNRAVYETAKEKGYIDSVAYDSFIERFETENAARKERVENGQPVYGLSEFTKELYLEYEMDTLQKKYCEGLENEGMDISEEDRQQYYEENKDRLFVKQDDITIDYIKINYELEGMSQQEKDTWKQRLTEIYKGMDEQHSLKSFAEADPNLQSWFSSEQILSEEYSFKAREIGDILEYAEDLKQGESTPVLEENGALYLIECVERKDYDYQPIEEVVDNINKALREENYEEIIRKKAEEAATEAVMEKIYTFTKKHI